MRRVLAAVFAACVVLAGCSSPDPEATASAETRGDISEITIGTSETLAPSLEFDSSRQFTRAQTRVIWEGEGAVLRDGQQIMLDIYGESLEDGTQEINSYDGLPRPFLLAPEMVGEDLFEALTGARVGTRLLHVAPASEDDPTEPPVVFVIDVLPVRATGTPVEPRADMPVVAVGDGGEPRIAIPDGVDPPPTLETATLMQGTGEQIRAGSHVVVQYKGVYWEDGETFDSSWDPGKAPFETQIGVGQVPLGWDQGLIDRAAGSQVVMVLPPRFGYPDQGTLVFVVDILDVWNTEE